MPPTALACGHGDAPSRSGPDCQQASDVAARHRGRPAAGYWPLAAAVRRHPSRQPRARPGVRRGRRSGAGGLPGLLAPAGGRGHPGRRFAGPCRARPVEAVAAAHLAHAAGGGGPAGTGAPDPQLPHRSRPGHGLAAPLLRRGRQLSLLPERRVAGWRALADDPDHRCLAPRHHRLALLVAPAAGLCAFSGLAPGPGDIVAGSGPGGLHQRRARGGEAPRKRSPGLH